MKSTIGKLSVLCLALGLYSNAHSAANAVAMEANGIPTGVLNLGVLVSTATAVTQLTFPTTFVGPVFEGWYSTIRVCYDGASLLGITVSGSVTVNFEILADSGSVVKTLPGINILTGACVTYTSDAAGDPLFSGVPLGLYKVRVTNSLNNIVQLGSLNGVINSTGRDVESFPLSGFIAKGKKLKKKLDSKVSIILKAEMVTAFNILK